MAGARVTVVDDAGRRPARLKVPVALVRKLAATALATEGITRGEIAVLVTRDPRIRVLNRTFRRKDKATNVLSFPQDDPKSGGHIGDVAISLDYVERQGRETGAGFRFTFAFYLVHGVLHLLGYDHHAPAEARRMYRRTDEILAAAGVAGEGSKARPRRKTSLRRRPVRRDPPRTTPARRRRSAHASRGARGRGG